VWAEELRIQ